ncbi:hypothetical protein C8R45DRAFT_1076303 [Mycena sanguinolenta]|nr:hypothetical protein C8R45DRAFT_1076303 [Mycena sanguinolenta]
MPQKKRKQNLTGPLSALSPDICVRYPSELHDYILDHLHNDKHTLFACSLVCRAWNASSRYHLFQNACTIRVHHGNFREFCELLACQRLNAYIGRLHLQSHLIHETAPDEGFQFNQHLSRLGRLPHLRYLHLDYHHDDVHAEFLAALTQNFPSINEIEFTSMHFTSFTQFVHIMDSLNLLRRISLDRVLFYDRRYGENGENLGGTAPSYMPSNLTDVVAHCGYDATAPVLLWLLSQPYVRRLAVAIEPQRREEHTALLSDILRMLGSRLEHLIIKDADNTHLPDLSLTTGLHTFTISGIQCLQTNTSVDLDWVSTLLSQVHSPDLKCVVFVVDLRERRGLDLLDWARIREFLAQQRSLRRVQFYLSAHKKWATPTIADRLSPRAYALRVGQLEGRYRYSLDMFDH